MITIINFGENPLKQFSEVSKLADVKLWHFVSNSLSDQQRDEVRSLFDDYYHMEKPCLLHEYSIKQPTGRIVQDAFTFAFNDATIDLLAYSDGSSNFSDNLIKEAKGGQAIIAKGKSTTPFVMNLKGFRQGLRAMDVFNAVTSAFNSCFAPTKEANFELFFTNVALAFSKLVKEPVRELP